MLADIEQVQVARTSHVGDLSLVVAVPAGAEWEVGVPFDDFSVGRFVNYNIIGIS